ncbi:DUF4157 domain-containing protein [Saccharopolyspora flava]|uniref:eCIS core domain-containing protein n=1 Tax=Saccharopolyspora flava TaxID=95161 RepID=A0A1I6SXK8_9PSEU|nr:DUF4157 domain-containing protein [Saccharopolyspora flava]SFS81623.1 protein of unknown function [Saccharopolyspora flava]
MHAEHLARSADARTIGEPARRSRHAARSPLLALQSAVGNAVVVQMLRSAGHPGALERDEGAKAGATVQDVLRTAGSPLDEGTRTDMETRLRADFSDVRVHTDSPARESAAQIGARAYTSGNHVVLGEDGGDEHTLLHELGHVIQQRSGRVAGTDRGDGLAVSDPDDRFEREAEANARRVLAGAEPLIREPARSTTATAQEAAVQRYVVVRPGEADYPTLGSRDEEGRERAPGADFFPSQERVGDRYVSADGEPNIRYNGAVPLRISAKRDLAVEDVRYEAKAFFATDKRIGEANERLNGIVGFQRAGSGNHLILRRTRRMLKIKDRTEELTLWQVEPVVTREAGVQRGLDVRLAQRCNEIAEAVTSRRGLEHEGEGRYLAAVNEILGELTSIKASRRQAELERTRNAAIGKLPKPVEAQAYVDHVAGLLQQALRLRENEPEKFVGAARKFGLNRFTPPPKIGDVLMLKAVRGDGRSGAVDFHVAPVIATSGGDHITMENFARHQGGETLSSGDPQWYFQMYGTEQGRQTWHEQWGWENRFRDRLVLSIVLSA